MSGADIGGAAASSTQPRNDNRRHKHRPRHRKNNENGNSNPAEVNPAAAQSQDQGESSHRNPPRRQRRPKQQQQQQQQDGQPQQHDTTAQTQTQQYSRQQEQPSAHPHPEQEQSQQRQKPDGSRRNRQRKGRGQGENRDSRPDGANSNASSNINNRRVTAGQGRVFGAGLTQAQDGSVQPQQPAAQEGLRADVPDFVPGQPLPHSQIASADGSVSGKQKGRRPRRGGKNKDDRGAATAQQQQAVVYDKSTADDITTRIHEDIAHNIYECPVCTSEIGRKTKVWSCTLCWTVFHLGCIRKWASNEGSAVTRPRGEVSGDDSDQKRQWRCPGCNLPHEIMPAAYSCWCEKETDPRPLPGLPPHSCGQTCSKPRNGCPHPCDSVCHAGPCPPCSAMGPTQSCFCGRHESTKKCVDTDYENGWSCGEVCGEYLPCMNHTCSRKCHEGLCGACEETVDARCYCGKVTTTMLCSAQGDEEESQRYNNEEEPDEDDLDEWTGTFACKDICGRLFDCGKHICERPCHPQDAETPHCPKAPDMITHCPCGKTKLSDINDFVPRQSCEDPVPRCSKPCGKSLPCGHLCPMPCHSGSCNPCFQAVYVKCRCGRSEFKTLCHQGINEPPQCMRVCKATLNCGRHACLERCCSGERKSIERLATKRKLRSLNVQSASSVVDDVEAEHVCTRVCGRPLKCGHHTCPELCHKGACGSCREAIFDEISCNCGRTVAYPPLPCGSKPPACSYQCHRPKPCGHPQTPHNCHTDEESCPKCPFLMDKRCMCGKKVMKNQPCYLASPRCGLICNEELKCGSHNCKKTCHAPGECEDADQPCQQACGKTKKLCPHPCTEKCHAPYPCPEKPCETRMEVTCQCGRIKELKRCGMSLDKARAGATFIQPRIACDEECARLERNRTLASALNVNINPTTTTATNAAAGSSTASTVPYSDETLDRYLSLSSSATLSTLQTYEQKLHDLAHNQTKRSTRFTPARAAFRAFVHSLAADWGFSSESFDPEPHRYVEVYKSIKWFPPAPLSNQEDGPVAIGICGISVAEGIRMRDRERAKERESKRAAAAALAAVKAKATEGGGADSDGGAAGGGESSSGGGWAQVARKKTGPADSPFGFSMPTLGPSGPSFGNGRFGALVLKSNVGRGKQVENLRSLVKKDVKKTEEVADDWEQEVDAEETGESQREDSGEKKEAEAQ